MPLFWLSLMFMVGILLSASVQLAGKVWLGMAAAGFVLALGLSWIRSRAIQTAQSTIPATPIPFHLVLFAISIMALGAARYQLSLPDLNSMEVLAHYNNLSSEARVTGVIIQPPQILENQTNLRIKVQEIQIVGEQAVVSVKGELVARLRGIETWQYGDRLQVRGHLETPPEFEDFSYREYLAQQGVYSYMGDGIPHRLSSLQGSPILAWIYAYKKYALETVYRLWPDPEASLLAGILLGDESGIPDEVDQAFRDTGTSHIIVISGFNITIIAGLLMALFSRLFGSGEFGVRWAAIFALLGIALYTILVGADAAVVRAAIMGGLALFATLVGRRQVGLNTLALVAAAMVAINPQVLWSVSFQLSFAATLGLVLYADPLKESFERLASKFVALERAQKWSPAVGEYFLFTLAAQVLVLPVIIYHFQRISLSSLLANPLILPVQPPLMMLGGLALLVGTVYFPLGQLLAWITWPFVVYTIHLVEQLAKIPGGALNLGEVRLVVVILFYALLFGLTFVGRQFRKVAKWFKPGAALVGLMVLTILIWRSVMAAPDGRLHMTLLDVGTGDGILIESPAGRKLLIDGGPSRRALSDALGRRLPLGKRQLDWLVIAAAGDEQIGGLADNLDRFVVEKVLWAGPDQGRYVASDLQSYILQKDIPLENAAAGQILDLGEGASLKVLEVGQRGAVLLLEWEKLRVLLPIGLDFELLTDLESRQDLKGITALLLAESGYAPVNPTEWIDSLEPQMVLLSVAAGDREGLPSPETLEAAREYNLLRTDQNGWIELATDGEQVWVEVEKR
ncbi:MAG: ComEC/Rec2 family competence protein [Anaerolineales bacterium]